MFREMLLIQILEKTNLNQAELFQLDLTRCQFLFNNLMRAFLHLENGSKLTYYCKNCHLINLTQTLGLLKLDHLSTIHLCGVDLIGWFQI